MTDDYDEFPILDNTKTASEIAQILLDALNAKIAGQASRREIRICIRDHQLIYWLNLIRDHADETI